MVDNIVRRTVLDKFINPNWAEVSLLLLPQLYPVQRRIMVEEIYNRSKKQRVEYEQKVAYEYIHHNHLLFAGSCLVDDVLDQEDPKSRELGSHIVGDLLDLWHKPDPKTIRKEVEDILISLRGSMYEQPVIGYLLKARGDIDPSIRQRAKIMLGKLLRPQESLIPLLLQNLHDSSPSVQDDARRTLEQLGWESEELVELLVRIAQDENEPLHVRRHAVRALINLKKQLQYTLGFALLESNRMVRHWAKLAEGMPFEILASCTPTLTEALLHGEDPAKDRAAWLLGRLKLSSDASLEALADLARTGSTPLLRYKAIWSLTQSAQGLEEIREVLHQIAKSDEDPETRKYASAILESWS